ncbi:TolB family protein [Streptomyces sp. NPDC090493]|uniref:TolB family protein n=1 Tax=Streptomyces sp. NPDC090493 TaxID=3365964 RepID=UPI0037FC3FED
MVALLTAAWPGLAPDAAAAAAPAPPAPERVQVRHLPLPPTAPSRDPGSCTAEINPHHTGCMDADWDAIQSGGFTPDGRNVTATVQFTGAPADAGAPGGTYTGLQLVLIRTDGTTFPSGDAWKCLTCGVPDANKEGASLGDLGYPQPFKDGRRILAGANIVSCGNLKLTDDRCTPANTRVYPIRWNTTADGSGPGGSPRELRLHPDQVHIGFSGFDTSNGALNQFAYLARLQFDPKPTTGSPAAPRYDLTKVTRLFNPKESAQAVHPDPDNPKELVVNPAVPAVGELRGFTQDGKEALYVGYPTESSNIDVYAVNLSTGAVRRLTSDPEYVDPVQSSPDDKWIVALDTRGSGRQMFLAGMRAVPPLTDLVTTGAVSSARNNHQRRFFQPYLIDRYGDRGDYAGQQLNAGDTSPGGIADPNWNAGADAWWSPDGTAIAYYQMQVVSPACGGSNPLQCPQSTEPGGRHSRLMLATLPDRKPVKAPTVAPISDTVPWGTPYEAGEAAPKPYLLPEGTYTLRGKDRGSAEVTIEHNDAGTAVGSVAVTYSDYSDDGQHILNGTEKASGTQTSLTSQHVDWYSDLIQTGAVQATKTTGPDGFHLDIDFLQNIFQATGTLTTTVDGHSYFQPANGT